MRGWCVISLLLLASLALSQTTHITYSSTDAIFPNPERGTYIGYDRASEASPLSLSSLRQLSAQNITLINPTYYLDAFVNSDLSSAELSLLQTDLDNFRKAGLKAILRFAYTHSESDPSAPDAPLNIVLRHLEQLRPILQQNADVIVTLQAGFIGAWGEWHHSYNGLDTSAVAREAIIRQELADLPTDRTVQIRTVRFKQAIFGTTPLSASEAYSGDDNSRVGFHDDALLGSWDSQGLYWLTGTIGDTNRTRPYLQAETRYTPMGGECYATDQLGSLVTCANVEGEMSRMHWSYFHRDWQPDVIAYLQNNGCFDEIDRRLGYRYVLQSADITGAIQPGGAFSLTLQITNAGWAALFNPRPVEILLRNQSDGTIYIATLPDDPRTWAPGSTTQVNATIGIPSTMPSGSYELLLNLPDGYASLHDRPEYAIRLANPNLWDGSTGYNDLLTSVSIDPSAGGQSYSGNQFFQPQGGVVTPPPVSDIPSLISPAANAINVPTSVRLFWHAGAHATSYLVQVSDDSQFSTFALNDSSVTDTTRLVSGLGSNRIYFWRVKSQGPTGQNGFSSTWSFTTVTVAGPTGSFSASPSTLPPGGGTVTLTWSSTNADSATITPGIGPVGAQGSTTTNVAASTTFTLTLIGASRRTYTAAVTVSSLVLPDIPVTIAPSQGQRNVPTTTTCLWRSAAHASSYQVQVSDDSTFGIVTVNDSTLTDTSRQVAGLGTNRIYFWRVRAHGTAGWSSFSPTVQFTTADRPSPAGGLTADPDTLPTGGGVSTLSWTSSNADSASIDGGIGSVALQGNRSVSLSDSRTYTLTLYGSTTVRYSVHIVVLSTQPPDIPLGYNPSDGQINVPLSTILRWHPVSRAERYHLQVSDDPSFPRYFIDDSTVTDTAHQVSGLDYDHTYYWRVNAIGTGGVSAYSSVRSFTTGRQLLPGGTGGNANFDLEQNYPNPFNTATTILVRVTVPGHVNVAVFNTLGRCVAQLVDADLPVGAYPLRFEGRNLASGMYFCHAQMGLTNIVKRMILIK
jgi:hypothetical protein